ncbi:MAG: S49 family peptidase [Verrucomicrobia bacterium]|nr:S49 family peptidase [Verrucomicrobiota bacterium]
MNARDLILTQEPWAIAPESMDGIIGLAMDVAAGKIFTLPQTEAPKSILSVENGVATIDIKGPLLPSVDEFDRVVLGATGLDEIESAVREAAADPSVESIALNIDSPGGTVRGTPEAADAIYEASKVKPVTAHTSGTMASAAYWLGSQAQTITMTRSASVGSIGVMVPHIDQSKRAEMLGVKVELFTTGKFKAAGFPGTSLTEAQRELIQERIDQVFGDFKAAVTRQGRAIPAEAMQGQTFYGPQAEALGLANIVRNGSSASASVDTLRGGMDEQNAQANQDELNALEGAISNDTAPETAPESAPEGEPAPAQDAAPEGEQEAAPEGSPEGEGESASALINDLKASLSALQSELEALKANQLSIDEAVAAKAAAIASRTTSAPVNVTPDAQTAESIYDQWKNATGAEKTRIFRAHRKELEAHAAKL